MLLQLTFSKLSKLQTQQPQPQQPQPQQPQQPQRLRPLASTVLSSWLVDLLCWREAASTLAAGFFIAGSSPSGSGVEKILMASPASCMAGRARLSQRWHSLLFLCVKTILGRKQLEGFVWARRLFFGFQLPCLNFTKGRAHGQAFPYSILLTSLKPQNRPQVSSLESHHQHHAQRHDVHLIEKALLHEAAPDDRQPPWAD